MTRRIARIPRWPAFACLGLIFSAGPLLAQDMEPRSYSASPTGLFFVVGAVGRSSGSVVVDASLPVEDVHAVVDSATAGVGATFALFGRTALLVAAFPYAWAKATGRVEEVAQSVTRTGFADARVKLSVNLLGGKAVSARDFAKARSATIAGMSVTVTPPNGQYFPAKLVNLGTNRWALKPEIGISRAIRRWTIEGYTGVWFYTTNESFYPGASVRSQDPLFTLQGHVSYTFRPRLWVAFDATWYTGGSTTINGIGKSDLQRNSRVGGTLSLPLASAQSIKVAYSTGATTRFGGDFNTIVVAWQLSWLRSTGGSQPP